MNVANGHVPQALFALLIGTNIRNLQPSHWDRTPNKFSRSLILRSSSRTKLLAHSVLLVPDAMFAVQVTDVIELQPVATFIAMYAAKSISSVSKCIRDYIVFSIMWWM